MKYNEAVEYVHSLSRFGSVLGLDNMRNLLEKLGNPQNKLKFLHIAGTNGKGSCTVMSASVLAHAGYIVGVNISPFVLEFRERFMINGRMISESDFAFCLSQVKKAADEMLVENLGTCTEFEVVTAVALYYFALQRVDIVCLEVGMGGRYDATNIIQNTEAVCIMSIGLDHVQILGNTTAKIAYEKCGVIKNGAPVITYPTQPQDAMEVIKQQCAQKNSELIQPDDAKIVRNKIGLFENVATYDGLELNIPFPGEHQTKNAAVVVEAMRALAKKGYKISEMDIVKGIASAKFPARVEVLSRTPLVILDGGHNIDGAKALAEVLSSEGITGLHAVVGILGDKEPAEMLHTLAPFIEKVYAVEPNNPRALSADLLADIAKKYVKQVEAFGDVEMAITAAKKTAIRGLLVCGSLYLAADARKFLTSNII